MDRRVLAPLVVALVLAVSVLSSAQTTVVDDVRARIGKSDMAVPVSDEDALAWGMDSTPTLVLVDRDGKVAMCHPGGVTREELEPRIQALLRSKASR